MMNVIGRCVCLACWWPESWQPSPRLERLRERGVMCVVVEEIVFLQEAQLKKIGVVLIILVVVTAATRDRRAAKQ